MRFLEGTDFYALGAIVKKTKVERDAHTQKSKRKEKNNAWECMNMCCIKKIASWIKPNPNYSIQHNQAHNL